MNVLTLKKCKETTTLISKAGVKLDQRIHDVAVSGIAHWLQCGDNTILTELVKAMPKSGRGNALKFFISKHTKGMLKWDSKANNGTGGYKGKKLDVNSWEKIAIVMDANKAPFYMKEDKEPSVWNEKAAVLSLVAKLKKHAKEHELCEESKRLLSAFA